MRTKLKSNSITMLCAQLFVFLIMLPVVAQAADWRFYGRAMINKVEEDQFYDAEGVQYPSETTAMVWTEGFSKKAIDKIIEKGFNKLDEKTRKAVGKRAATGYSPDFCLLPAVESHFSKQDLDALRAELSITEILVSSGNVIRTSAVYNEIDCAGKRIALLSITLFDSDGNLSKTGNYDKSEFTYILPDSSAERLMQMVCPKHRTK